MSSFQRDRSRAPPVWQNIIGTHPPDGHAGVLFLHGILQYPRIACLWAWVLTLIYLYMTALGHDVGRCRGLWGVCAV